MSADAPFCGTVLTDDEVVLLNHDGIRAQLSSLHIAHYPGLFASSITERTHHVSHAPMVMGSTTIDDSGCELILNLPHPSLNLHFQHWLQSQLDVHGVLVLSI